MPAVLAVRVGAVVAVVVLEPVTGAGRAVDALVLAGGVDLGVDGEEVGDGGRSGGVCLEAREGGAGRSVVERFEGVLPFGGGGWGELTPGGFDAVDEAACFGGGHQNASAFPVVP
ncbi:hypothetical protein [Nannocystis sp.]|uniref:hypothetical protein n=1 Tax=Nannocystis sp. TaxID=1962667 RepID=UPI0025E8DE39|nr:hypothetical protein [Nannocystis sp.]MBK7829666.1 hypothetical protein [Nannocystis sp.]